MATKNEAKKGPDVVERVQKLVALATSDNEEEARTAAVQAVRLMTEHKLAVVPAADLESAKKIVEGAQSLIAAAKQQANQKLLMGLALGFFGAKKF